MIQMNEPNEILMLASAGAMWSAKATKTPDVAKAASKRTARPSAERTG